MNSVVTSALGSNVESLTLTGNAAANTLASAAGNNVDVGGWGNDTLAVGSTSSADVYRWRSDVLTVLNWYASSASIANPGIADRLATTMPVLAASAA